MAIDLKKLSDEELLALESGDLSKISDKVLLELEKTASEEERAQRTVQTPRSAFSMVRPEISGATFAPEEETMRKGLTVGARYGAPIAVGVATGGVGLVPAAITGLSAGAGETFAQFLEQRAGEREEISPTTVAASTIAGAAPIFQFKAAAVPAEQLISPAVKSFLATVSGQIGTTELSRYVEKGEFEGIGKNQTLGQKATEAVFRWGLPVGAAWLSAKGSELEKAVEDVAAIRAEGRRPILMDIKPQYAELEAKNFRTKGTIARGLADEMDADMAGVLSAAFGDVSPQSQSEIASMLAPYATAYDDAKSALIKARERSAVADDQLKLAEATRSADLEKIKIAAEVAENERLIAENNFDVVADGIFGKRAPIMSDKASLGALQRRVKAVAKAAEDGVDSGLDALYANTNLRPNDVVVSKQDVLRGIKSRKAKGRALEGDEARGDAERAVELFFGDRETATLEQLRKFKKKIADNLPQGSTPDAAARYASAIYDTLTNASSRFIERTYSEDVLSAFKEAQRRAAANFQTREGGAIELLKGGDFEGFYKAVKAEGRLGNMMAELDAYANSLSRLTGSAIQSGQIGTAKDIANINIARQFKKDVNNIILNGIIGESIVGRESGLSKVSDIIDPKKFIQNLGFFESQGFTLRQLGIDSKEVSKLIKANAMVGKDPLTVGQLNDFLELLPSTGGDVAAARIAYRKAVADGMIEAGAKEKTAAFSKAKKIADDAKLDEAARQAEFNMASSDPLTKFFSENGSMLIGNGALQNSNWVDSIIKKDSGTINRFISSLQASGRNDVLMKLKEAAIASTVKRFVPDVDVTRQRLDAESIVAPFISNNREMVMQRENLKSILGKEEYDRMVALVVEPMRKVLVNKVALGQPIYNMAEDLKGLISTQAIATGRSTAGTLMSNAIMNTANLIERKYYGVLAGIWLNPKYSKQLVKAGYDLNRFAQLSEANRVAVQLAMKEDEEQAQADLRRQYIR